MLFSVDTVVVNANLISLVCRHSLAREGREQRKGKVNGRGTGREKLRLWWRAGEGWKGKEG